MTGVAHVRINEHTQDISTYFQNDDGVKQKNFNPYGEDKHQAELKRISREYNIKVKHHNRSKSKKHR